MTYMDFDFDRFCSIANDYFQWMYDLVCHNRFSKQISYRKLLMHLNATEFKYTISKDSNRAYDGMDLRWRYSLLYDNPDVLHYIDGPCSMLEMLVALAIKIEDIMDDPALGDRTQQWFWGMIVNLGLGSMVDERFDKKYVDYVLDRFFNRNYKPDGKGGLFLIRDSDRDLRDVEIWCQLCWYLDTIT